MKTWDQKTPKEKQKELIELGTKMDVRRGDIEGHKKFSEMETLYEKFEKSVITADNLVNFKPRVWGGFGEQNYSETDSYYEGFSECTETWDFSRWVNRAEGMAWKDESVLRFPKSAFAGCKYHGDDIPAHSMFWMDYWLLFRNLGNDDPRIQEWYSPDLQELNDGTFNPDNYSKYYGLAAYQKIDNEGVYPDSDQKLNLKFWNQDFDLDHYQKGELLIFLSEQFQDRQIKIWRYPIWPNEGNVFGLYTGWVVEVKYIFVLQNQSYWKEELDHGDSSFDLRISKKFYKWDDASNFYQEMRHLDLLKFKDLGETQRWGSAKTFTSSRPHKHGSFEYGKISNGDSGIHWKSVGEAFNWICHICGQQTERKGGTHLIRRGCTIDHIVPQSKGGANTWNNVLPAHWDCNIKKNARI